MSAGFVLIFVGLLFFVAHVLSAVFERTGLPDVLLLLIIGLLIGPGLGLVSEADFGAIGPVFTTIALVGILFESGLGLDIDALTHSMLPALRLTVLNFVASLAVTVPFAMSVLGLSLGDALVLGSIVGGTASAVVIPMVARLRVSPRTGTILVLESSVSDVVCIVGVLALLEALTSGEVAVAPLIGHTLASFLLPVVVGITAGIFWSATLERVRRLEHSLSLTLGAVFIVYGVSDAMGHSGAIAALSFGVLLGNIRTLNHVIERLGRGRRLRPVDLDQTERAVYAEIAFVIKTFFFVYVGLVMSFADGWTLLLGAALTGLLYAVRLPVVLASLRSEAANRSDAIVTALMTPKGLAAAVLASLPAQAGLPGGAIIQDVVFSVILCSILATSLLTMLHARGWLRVPYGWLLAGYPEELAAPLALPEHIEGDSTDTPAARTRAIRSEDATIIEVPDDDADADEPAQPPPPEGV